MKLSAIFILENKVDINTYREWLRLAERFCLLVHVIRCVLINKVIGLTLQ